MSQAKESEERSSWSSESSPPDNATTEILSGNPLQKSMEIHATSPPPSPVMQHAHNDLTAHAARENHLRVAQKKLERHAVKITRGM